MLIIKFSFYIKALVIAVKQEESPLPSQPEEPLSSQPEDQLPAQPEEPCAKAEDSQEEPDEDDEEIAPRKSGRVRKPKEFKDSITPSYVKKSVERSKRTNPDEPGWFGLYFKKLCIVKNKILSIQL